MAYYAYDSAHEAVLPVTRSGTGGIGAYYAWNSAHEGVLPVNGLGQTPESELVDDAVRRMLGARRPVDVVAEWAKQAGDFMWSPLAPETQMTLLPITPSEVGRVTKAAFGHPLGIVGVYARGLVRRQVAEQAFSGTAYGLSGVLAVYSLADRAPVARERYLYLAGLRGPEDKEGGRRSLGQAAAELAGTLVYPVSLPLGPRARRPGRVLPPSLGQASPGPEPAPVEPGLGPAAEPSPLALLPWVVGGALAAGIGWYLVTR